MDLKLKVLSNRASGAFQLDIKGETKHNSQLPTMRLVSGPQMRLSTCFALPLANGYE